MFLSNYKYENYIYNEIKFSSWVDIDLNHINIPVDNDGKIKY